MPDIQTFVNLAIALGIGAMIGVERGWSQRRQPEGGRVAGLRTFTLFGLLGGVAAVLAGLYGIAALVVTAAAAGAVVVVAMVNDRGNLTDRGITTEIALLVTFALGVLAGYGEHQVAVACAVVVTVLLGMKPPLHRWLETLHRAEMLAAFRLLVMSLVILPVLPNRGFGPWHALNPYVIWLMVVLISAMSFGGYMAVKWAGPHRGLMVTGFLGGMTSSTAISVAMARTARDAPGLEAISAAAALAGSTVMYLRILVAAAVFSPALALALAAPMAAMTLAGLATLAVIWPRGAQARTGGTAPPRLKPFDLGIPLRFGAILAVVMVAAAALRAWLGNSGLLVVSGIAGLTDVDAPTLTAANMVTAGLDPAIGRAAVLIAAGVNVLVKLGVIFWIGGRRMGLRVSAGFLGALAAGAAAWWATL
ncbi:MAG: DUF4010 domain-containing protein [Alphaproteobacteria bacterium]|nr:DUF4010 domain-containing protein [Alphaproteobacteria bacterium]